MTKKKIMDLVNQDRGILSINTFSRLVRAVYEQKDPNRHIDRLELVFEAPLIENIPIKARDYAGIMEEIAIVTEDHMKRLSKKLISDIKAGYIY